MIIQNRNFILAFIGPIGCLTDQKLIAISTLIGQRYPELGLKLGLTEAQLAEVKDTTPDNLQHQIFHMLSLWVKKEQKQATLHKLNEVLKELGWISVLTQIQNTPDIFYVIP